MASGTDVSAAFVTADLNGGVVWRAGAIDRDMKALSAICAPNDADAFGDFWETVVREPGRPRRVEVRSAAALPEEQWIEIFAVRAAEMGRVHVWLRSAAAAPRTAPSVPASSAVGEREALLRRLQALLTKGPGPALVLVDIDHLRWTNDALGSDAGDEVLAEVASRIDGATRPEDVVSRTGGDDFAILLPATAPDVALAIARRIHAAIRGPMSIRGRVLQITASLGVAGIRPGIDAPEILRDAETALIEAKRLGRNRVETFQPALRKQAGDRAELDADLRRAFETGALRINYQPVIELSTRRVMGAEALLSWEHPRRGLVPPAEFIAHAEESGLIVPIGRWMLGESCLEAAGWGDLVEPGRKLVLWVNLSGRQLAEPSLAADVMDALGEARLPPDQLGLEVTEAGLELDSARAAKALGDLKATGVRLAMDDFGTGHSSLTQLRRFRFNVLKIDRSFVAGLPGSNEDAAIVNSVVQLGRALGLTVVGEGVETQEQLRMLKSFGCDQALGYLFSRPRKPADLRHLLRVGLPPAK